MPNEQLPHRKSSSRKTHLTDTHAIHTIEDGKHKQEITQSADPNGVLEFMRNLVEWYESDVESPEELLMYAEVDDAGFVYIRDRQGGEWAMWAVNEWTAPKPGVNIDAWKGRDVDPLEDEDTGIDESTIHAVINAIVWAYEEPSTIKEQFNRMQIESCSPN